LKRYAFLIPLMLIGFVSFAVTVSFWEIPFPEGTGPTAKGIGGIYNNPAVLSLETNWQFGLMTCLWNSAGDEHYHIVGATLIQPYQYGFAGGLDILYGQLKDQAGSNTFASFGYAISGLWNRLSWGARIIAGYFDNDPESSVYGSANLGLMYSVLDNTHILFNFNAPQIVTTKPLVFDINRPETFNIGAGILTANDIGRVYAGMTAYNKNENPYFGFMFGGGIKMAFLNWDVAFVGKDLFVGIPIDEMNAVIKASLYLDFEYFAIGVGAQMPLTTYGFSETILSAFVRAKW